MKDLRVKSLVLSVALVTALTVGLTSSNATTAKKKKKITTSQIANGAITTAKLANGAVTTAKLASGSARRRPRRSQTALFTTARSPRAVSPAACSRPARSPRRRSPPVPLARRRLRPAQSESNIADGAVTSAKEDRQWDVDGVESDSSLLSQLSDTGDLESPIRPRPRRSPTAERPSAPS